MGEMITLKSPYDGFELSAWRVPNPDARRGGLVLIQEIFGVTDHVREMAAAFAEDGYEVIAPSFYDRLEMGFTAEGYGQDAVQRGVAFSAQTPWGQVVGDLQAAIDALKPPVFTVGYCWGGAAAWLAACRCTGLSAAVAYYGRRITELVSETPKVPIILHFGRHDASIPMDRVAEIEAAHPDIPVFTYDAGHGFASDRRADYSPDAARLARLRTLAHFHNNGSGARGEM